MNIQRGAPSVVANDARIKAGLNLGVPVVADTAHGLNGGLDSLGLVIQIRTTGDWYKRDTFPGGHKWTKIGSGSGADSATFYTIFRSDTSRANIYAALSGKLNPSDTVGKWVSSIKRSGDSVYYQKNGVWVFAFLDSLGSGGGATNITVVRNATNVNVNSSSGSSGILDTATKVLAGAQSPFNKAYTDSLALGLISKSASVGNYGSGLSLAFARNDSLIMKKIAIAYGGTWTTLSDSTALLTLDSTFWCTRGWRQKLADSLAALINAKQNQLSGNGYVKFSSTTPSYLTPTQVTADLNQATTTLQGLVPPPGTATGKVLQDDLGWHAPASGFTNPMTTNGDMIYQAGGVPARLPVANHAGMKVISGASGAINWGDTAASYGPSDTTSTIVTQTALYDSVNYAHYVYSTGWQTAGDSVWFIGHSYTFGANASTTAKRWTSIVAANMGATEVNLGVAGKTLMYQIPKNYQGPSAMTQTLSIIPKKTSTRKALFFEFGLNDMGQTAPDYSVANFKLAYDTVLSRAIVDSGWAPSQVVLMGEEWIGQAGLTYYGTVTGNAAPTQIRAQQFVLAIKQEAQKWGCKYIDNYNSIALNDTTLIGGIGNVHPTDSGYAYIALRVGQKLAINAGNIWIQNTGTVSLTALNQNVRIGATTATGVTTPPWLSMGGPFANTTGSASNIKIKVYDDGIPTNNSGFGVSSGHLEYHVFANGEHTFYQNSVKIGGIGFSTNPYIKLGAISAPGVSTALPTLIDLGNTYTNVPGKSLQAKINVYNNGTTHGGFGYSVNGLEYYNAGGLGHLFYVDDTVMHVLGKTYFAVQQKTIGAGNSSDSILVLRTSSTSQMDTVMKVAQSSVGGGSSPFSDATPLIKNAADATKQIRWDASGLTTGNTRVITALDANYIPAASNLAQTFSLTQTFTLAPIFSPLTGYLKGNGASVVTAVAAIPVADVTGAAPLASPTFTGTISTPSIKGTGSSPSISGGTAIPNGGGFVLDLTSRGGSNLLTGYINLQTGTGSGTGTTIATITLPVAQSSANFKIFLQDTYTGAHVPVATNATSTTTFNIFLQGTATLNASDFYTWNYFIVQ